MTEYRIVYTYKRRADGLVYDETYTPQRKTWRGWRNLTDHWHHGPGFTELERARLDIDSTIREEEERQIPVLRTILEYPKKL